MTEMQERVAIALRDELVQIGYGIGTINAGQLSEVLARAAIGAITTADALQIIQQRDGT